MFFKKAKEKKAAIERAENAMREVALKYEEYVNEPELDQIAQKAIRTIVYYINQINRELSDVRTIRTNYAISSTFDNDIRVSSEGHDGTVFYLDSIKTTNINERHALCLAFENLVRHHLQMAMPKDKSGTDYTLQMNDLTNDRRVVVSVTYSATNGSYKTAAQRAQETVGLVNKYIDSPITQRAAENFAKLFINVVKNLDRDIRKKEIRCQYSIAAKFLSEGYCNEVIFYYGNDFRNLPYHIERKRNGYIINFSKENLKPIGTSDEMCAFVKAVSICAEKIIKEKYSKDESGSSYLLKTMENKGEIKHHMVHYGCIISFEYYAVNNNYTAPTEW